MVAITNIFKSFINKRIQNQYLKLLSGQTPIFSNFGEDIYASDVVKNCVRCIATEIGKLEPKHIRIDDKQMQTFVKGSINRLFTAGPNPLMTTKDFLEKIIWMKEYTYNCFIYPTYEKIPMEGGYKKRFTGLYPLNPQIVEFMQSINGEIWIKMRFNSGEEYDLPYKDLIHLRKDYSVNDLMGGDENGQPDNRSLLKVLNIDNTVLQGLEKGVKVSHTLRGLVKLNTMLRDEKQDEEIRRFEERLNKLESGIMPMDLKGEFVPLKVDPKMIDKDTMTFIQSRMLNHYGVSLPILNGDFTDEQYQAFYEKRLEGEIISLGQAFTRTMFTDREIDVGNKIIFYPQRLLFTNTKNRIAVADILGNRGALSDNQLLELFGYPPFEGGEKRHMSLNFVNRDIADKYQLIKAGKGGKEDGHEQD